MLFLIMYNSFFYFLDYKEYLYLASIIHTLGSTVTRAKWLFFVKSCKNRNIIHMSICIETLFNSIICIMQILVCIYGLQISHLSKCFIFLFIILFECVECVYKNSRNYYCYSMNFTTLNKVCKVLYCMYSRELNFLITYRDIMCKLIEFIGGFAIHFLVHTEEKPYNFKVGMYGIYAYIYSIAVIIFGNYELQLLQLKNKYLDSLCYYDNIHCKYKLIIYCRLLSMSGNSFECYECNYILIKTAYLNVHNVHIKGKPHVDIGYYFELFPFVSHIKVMIFLTQVCILVLFNYISIRTIYHYLYELFIIIIHSKGDLIIYTVYGFEFFPINSNKKDMPYIIQTGFVEYGNRYFINFYSIFHIKNRKRKNFNSFLLNNYRILVYFLLRLLLFTKIGILLNLVYFIIHRFLTPFGNFKMYYYSLSFYFPITKYMVIIILRRDEFYVFKLFPSISNRKVMPFLIQVGFAEYGYIYFISFYLICHMKYLKRKNFLLFLLNDYGIFKCFLVRLFLYSIMGILFILAYFNIYKILVPFGNFKIYIYFLCPFVFHLMNLW